MQIGQEFLQFSTDVERGRLKLFAKAIGELNPIYSDADMARKAGYDDVVAPPTFIYCLSEDIPDPNIAVTSLGLDVSKCLHAHQEVTQFRPICAGQTLHGRMRLADYFEKKGGTLKFVVSETEFSNAAGQEVASLKTTVVVQAEANNEQ